MIDAKTLECKLNWITGSLLPMITMNAKPLQIKHVLKISMKYELRVLPVKTVSRKVW
jgi:hypothetical protein